MGRKDGIADGVAFAHPTMTADEDFELLAKPGLFICAERDSIFTPDKEKKAREITAKKANNERIYSTWHTFLGTEHHFAVRGDERDPFIARAMGDAQALASNFFKGFRTA